MPVTEPVRAVPKLVAWRDEPVPLDQPSARQPLKREREKARARDFAETLAEIW
jgi:hypothetical protein